MDDRLGRLDVEDGTCTIIDYYHHTALWSFLCTICNKFLAIKVFPKNENIRCTRTCYERYRTYNSSAREQLRLSLMKLAHECDDRPCL